MQKNIVTLITGLGVTGFLLQFHSNYDCVLNSFCDKVRYWWKIPIFKNKMPPVAVTLLEFRPTQNSVIKLDYKISLLQKLMRSHWCKKMKY